MDAKLTLKLDSEVILRAKTYARQRKTSISRLVEQFLDSLTDREAEEELTPMVKRLSGVIQLPEDYDFKSDRSSHLENKHE